jgi:hypothetical protein
VVLTTGSGTNYSALPENGGVPDDTKQVVESNDGKIWTATTDHNGKFSVGDFFQADQRTGFVSFSAGSVAFDVVRLSILVHQPLLQMLLLKHM